MIERLAPRQVQKSELNVRRISRPRRLAGIPIALVVVCAVAIASMILAPSVAASPLSTNSRTVTAPYSGTPTSVKDITTSDCGSISLTHGPRFTLSSGVGHVQVNASATSAPSCRSPAFPSVAEVVGLLGFTTLNFSLAAGTHTVKSVWDLHWTVDLKASGAGPNPGNLQTGAVIEVYLAVYDATENGIVSSNDWDKIVNRTGDASVHFVGNQNVTVSVNQTFNASHVYDFLAAIEFGALAEIVQGATGGQVSAAINLATNGNGATLLALKGV
jgi:hypothetical protein